MDHYDSCYEKTEEKKLEHDKAMLIDLIDILNGTEVKLLLNIAQDIRGAMVFLELLKKTMKSL